MDLIPPPRDLALIEKTSAELTKSDRAAAMADRGQLRRRLLDGLADADAQPAIASGRIVVLGHCFGGLCALDLARAAPPGLLGAVSIHGALTPPADLAPMPISARVLVLHGWEDPIAPPADVLASPAN